MESKKYNQHVELKKAPFQAINLYVLTFAFSTSQNLTDQLIFLTRRNRLSVVEYTQTETGRLFSEINPTSASQVVI